MMGTGLNDSDLHRYLRVYNYYKELIRSGKLAPGTKLPSIRKCSAQLQLSRTTVENAYMMLSAEGYILSRPQSGFFVTELSGGGAQAVWELEQEEGKREKIRFDFASSNVDRDSFQFDLWRRYIKSALRQDERLLSYGEPQGERALRESLCAYLAKNRNVVCTPDAIVVGAGVQSLLHILCPMVDKRRPAIFYNPDFRQGRVVFEDYGFFTAGLGAEEQVADAVRKLKMREHYAEPPLLYLTPSQMTAWGDVMHISERMELIREAYEKNILLIEDDYNSEFRYYGRPTPSLQGLSGGKNVVYLGTFSRLLLPSIRMSFMILPPDLLEQYRKKRDFYNQTASKAEQIALCQFIRDGHLESQIRKTRKLYAAKARMLCGQIERVFGALAIPHLGEAGFLVLAEIKTDLTAVELRERAARAGIAVRVDTKKGRPWPRILLSCSTVAAERFEEALLQLKASWFS